MRVSSARIITGDITRLVTFYEGLTGVTAQWATPAFAEFDLAGFTLAIGDISTVDAFAPGSAEGAANRSVIVEFLVDDVDAEFARLRSAGVRSIVREPTTMPWGNRSLLVRDPDGTLVNLFTPATDAARRKWGVA